MCCMNTAINLVLTPPFPFPTPLNGHQALFYRPDAEFWRHRPRLQGLLKPYMLSTMEQQHHRQRLITQANAAETPGQIKAAKAALKTWQATHPNDPAINTLLGALSMREAWLRMNHEWD